MLDPAAVSPSPPSSPNSPPPLTSTHNRLVITIDGGPRTGKTKTASEVAGRMRKLGIPFLAVSTGLLYRAVAFRAMEENVISEEAVRLRKTKVQVSPTARTKIIEFAVDSVFEFRLGPLPQQPELWSDPAPPVLLYWGARDITKKITNGRCGDLASVICNIPEVKCALTEQLRSILPEHNLVVDGRDAGSRIFPDAALKIVLTATGDEVALRQVTADKPKAKQGSASAAARTARAKKSLAARATLDAAASPTEFAGAIQLHNRNGRLNETVTRIVERAQALGLAKLT